MTKTMSSLRWEGPGKDFLGNIVLYLFFASMWSNHSCQNIFSLTMHQSSSIRKAPIRRRLDSRLGKIPITRSRRRISSFTRSKELVVRNPVWYLLGSSKTALASSNFFSKTSMTWGAFSLYLSKVWFKRKWSVERSATSKIPHTREWISSWGVLGVASKIFFMKWVWHRCQVAPWSYFSIALFNPWWSSEVTKSTPFNPLSFNQMKKLLQFASDLCGKSGVLRTFEPLFIIPATRVWGEVSFRYPF